VTAHELSPIPIELELSPNLLAVTGDISNETSIQSCIADAKRHHRPINILIANASITDESNSYPIWDMPIELWETAYNRNVRGTILTIKYFLQSAEESQNENGEDQLEKLGDCGDR
jgi:NAD(P)-dependent dehydrogenase (short-subunit alcohol dehydrogenase family)